MYSRSRVLFAIIACVGTTAAAQQAPSGSVPLAAVSPWEVDFAETQCVASRDFGSKADPTSIAIRPPFFEGDSYEIFVARAGKGPPHGEELKGTVDFGRGPIKAWLLRFTSTDKTLAFWTFRLSEADMAQARSASFMHLRGGASLDASFTLTSVAAVMDQLEACTTALMRHWNWGPQSETPIVQQPFGDVRSIFSSDDFPREAMHYGQEGAAQFVLLVDEQGKVAGCHVVLTSGIPVFDAMGCSVLKQRARYRPAADGRGRPIRSMVVTPKVVWRIAP